MSKSLTSRFSTNIQLINIKLKDAIVQLWDRLQSAMLIALKICKDSYGSFVEYLSKKNRVYPYLLLGAGSFLMLMGAWKLTKNLRSKQLTTKFKQKRDKNSQWQQQLQSTNLTYQSGGYRSQDSLMSIKLPMDCIMEAQSEDDQQDRLFFEVIKNYRYT